MQAARIRGAVVGGAATLLALLGIGGCGDEPGPSRTVVLISLDTVRADRLGIYGNGPEVSPVLDELAASAVVFEQAMSVAPWTLPAHMSMLTGLDPVAHGVESPERTLPEAVQTVAELFAARGFRTAAFTGGGFVGTGWGLESGFELFDARRTSKEHLGFDRYIDRAVGWIEEHREEPYFLFLHSFDAHGPYDEAAPETLAKFRERAAPDGPKDHELYRSSYTQYARGMRFDQYGKVAEALNDYDAGIHEADAGVGKVLDALRRTGRFEDALVVVLSDHGESFYDHGLWIGHGIEMWDDQLRVPLIAKLPRGEMAGTRVPHLVDLVDVAPTLLEAAGWPPDPWMQGTSLASIARGTKRSRSYSLGGTYTTRTYSLIRGDFKFIDDSAIPPVHVLRAHLKPETPGCLQEDTPGTPFHTRAPDGSTAVTYYPNQGDPLGFLDDLPFQARLYHRKDDPAERHDISQELPDKLEEMRQALQSVFKESRRIHEELARGAEERELSEPERIQLEALGYTTDAQEQPQSELESQLESARSDPPARPPRSRALTEIDQRVHRVRLALRDRGRLEESELEELRSCAEATASWMEKVHQVRFRLRALWRVREIELLARQGGAALEIQPYVARVLAVRPRVAASTDPKLASKDGTASDEPKPSTLPEPTTPRTVDGSSRPEPSAPRGPPR